MSGRNSSTSHRLQQEDRWLRRNPAISGGWEAPGGAVEAKLSGGSQGVPGRRPEQRFGWEASGKVQKYPDFFHRKRHQDWESRGRVPCAVGGTLSPEVLRSRS